MIRGLSTQKSRYPRRISPLTGCRRSGGDSVDEPYLHRNAFLSSRPCGPAALSRGQVRVFPPHARHPRRNALAHRDRGDALYRGRIAAEGKGGDRQHLRLQAPRTPSGQEPPYPGRRLRLRRTGHPRQDPRPADCRGRAALQVHRPGGLHPSGDRRAPPGDRTNRRPRSSFS